MALTLRGFYDFASIALWTERLGGIPRLIEAQGRGVSELTLPLTRPAPRTPPLVMPRVLSHEEAPDYLKEVTGESFRGLEWIEAFWGLDSRLIGKDLELLPALNYLLRAPLGREYAVERDEDGGYRLISGTATGVQGLGELVIHSHRNRLALPSEQDFVKYETMAQETSRCWSLIYSRPRRGDQLSYVERVAPWVFEIRFWQDRVDRSRGERLTRLRLFEIRARLDPRSGGGIPCVDGMEVVERTLSGRVILRREYDDRLYPKADIQEFWSEVLKGGTGG